MGQYENKTSQEKALKGKSPLVFFVLVIVLSIPFWVIGGLTGIQLLPGLPIDALMVICPALAALILSYRENRKLGVAALLKRTLDFNRINSKGWYIIILIFMPIVSILSFFWIRLSGIQIPAPKLAVLPTLILCIMFFIGAICEELGWSGYVIDPMQHRFGAVKASILLGLFWAVYHYVALIQAHRSIVWIAWWSFGTVALRVISVWIFNNNGKSVFAVALFHMTINVTWQLFPINGSYYNPGITGFILGLAAIFIVIVYGPHTLVRKGDIKVKLL